MGKHFNFDLKGKYFINDMGKKIYGAAFMTHLIKKCGGFDNYSNKLFEIGYKGGHADGYMHGVLEVLSMLKKTSKRG